MSLEEVAIVQQPAADPHLVECDTCEETLSITNVREGAIKHLEQCPTHIVRVEAMVSLFVMVATGVEVFRAQPDTVTLDGSDALAMTTSVLNAYPAEQVWDDLIATWHPAEKHRRDESLPDDRSWFVIPGGHKFAQDPETGTWSYEGSVPA